MALTDFGSDVGIGASLCKVVDKLRGNMEPSDYKHVALGLIIFKRISSGFEQRPLQLLAVNRASDAANCPFGALGRSF